MSRQLEQVFHPLPLLWHLQLWQILHPDYWSVTLHVTGVTYPEFVQKNVSTQRLPMQRRYQHQDSWLQEKDRTFFSLEAWHSPKHAKSLQSTSVRIIGVAYKYVVYAYMLVALSPRRCVSWLDCNTAR